MKIKVRMKTPNCLNDSMPKCGCSYGDCCDKCMAAQELMKIANRWFSYGEYVTIEIDTKAHTAKVLER